MNGQVSLILGVSITSAMASSSMFRAFSPSWTHCRRKVGPLSALQWVWLTVISGLDCSGRLFLSDRAQLVFDFHQIVDGLKEVELGGSSIGTTKKGIGPAYSSKASRSGLRVHHLYDHDAFASKFRKLVENRFKRYGHFEYDTEAEIERYKELSERLKPYVVDGVSFIHDAFAANKRILCEGANALMLDIDFGTYPFVTSSSTCVGGVCTGLGIPPSFVGNTVGVIKAYTTRVGAGPFVTELLDVSLARDVLSLADVIAGYWQSSARSRRRVRCHYRKA